MAVLDATTYAGADIMQKIETAYNSGDLPSAGGTIDARGAGDQTVGTTITLGAGVGSKPCSVLLPSALLTFTENSTTPKIRIRGAGIRLLGVSTGSRALVGPATTFLASYSANAPLIEISPNAADARGPQHNSIEHVELFGTDSETTGGCAVLLRAAGFCKLIDLHIQYFRRTGVFPVQVTYGTVDGSVSGSYFNILDQIRLHHCAGGIEIVGNNALGGSCNQNLVSRAVLSTLSNFAIYNHGYAIANQFEDIDCEQNTGTYDIQVTGIADGCTLSRIYSESDTLAANGAVINIDSDSSVRDQSESTMANQAYHVTIRDCLLSSLHLNGVAQKTGIQVNNAKNTVIDGVMLKNFAVGVSLLSGADGTFLARAIYPRTTASVSDGGTSTTWWNLPGTLTMSGPLVWGSDASYDIGAAGATRPRHLNLGGQLLGRRNRPAQLSSGKTHNYDPGSTTLVLELRADPAGSVITGLSGGIDGRILFIENIGANVLTLQQSNGVDSLAPNRFFCPSFTDFVLQGGAGVTCYYDGDNWRLLAK